MSKKIIGQDFLELASGRRLALATEGGSLVTGTHRDGSAMVCEYEEDDILLTDKDGNIVVGPVSQEGAQILALRILNGDSRAMTEPQGLLILATMLVTLITIDDESDPDDDIPGADALDEPSTGTLN